MCGAVTPSDRLARSQHRKIRSASRSYRVVRVVVGSPSIVALRRVVGRRLAANRGIENRRANVDDDARRPFDTDDDGADSADNMCTARISRPVGDSRRAACGYVDECRRVEGLEQSKALL